MSGQINPADMFTKPVDEKTMLGYVARIKASEAELRLRHPEEGPRAARPPGSTPASSWWTRAWNGGGCASCERTTPAWWS